jgi:hypothetical protein
LLPQELHRLNAEFTPGMLSSCIDILIHFNLADEAYNMLTHLRHTAPDFHIDEYKVIDLARVCVQQDQFQSKYKSEFADCLFHFFLEMSTEHHTGLFASLVSLVGSASALC